MKQSVFPSAVLTARTIFCAMLLLTLMGCATAKSKDEAQLHARIGTALLQQGHFPDALRELLTAEKLDPSNAPIQNNLGLAFFMREKYQLAAQHIEKAISIDPSYSEARNNYGRVLIELGRYDDAIRELQKVIDDLTYPDPPKALINMGLARFRKGDFAAAKNVFARAIQLNRESCLGQTYYGRSLFELAQFQAASQALDNAVIICSANSGGDVDEAQYYSGLAYYKLGKTSAAISRMEEIVKTSAAGRYGKKAESLLKLMK